MIDVSKGATVFMLDDAAVMSKNEAMRRLELLRKYPAINNETILKLQQEWSAYRTLLDSIQDGAPAEGEAAAAAKDQDPKEKDKVECERVLTFFEKHRRQDASDVLQHDEAPGNHTNQLSSSRAGVLTVTSDVRRQPRAHPRGQVDACLDAQIC